MEFFFRPPGKPQRLGILPGSFNPPTIAHLTLAQAALAQLDQVVLVLPRAFPHKDYVGAGFDQRAAMLQALADRSLGLAAAGSDGGLFAEIAAECRVAYGPATDLTFICGRDAAERIVTWDYGTPQAIEGMLESFELLVASRGGAYEPPATLPGHIRQLVLPADLSHISASEVRRRIQMGLAWEHLVPGPIVPMVREIYRPAL